MASGAVENTTHVTMSTLEKGADSEAEPQNNDSSCVVAGVIVESQPVENKEQIKVSEDDSPPPRPYSLFTNNQKRLIIISGSFLTLVSYMGSTMYYPALNQISNDLHVTPSAINITVFVYLCTQGIVPVFVAEFAEKSGRRPAYILCFLFTIVANLGLALQNNYYALVFLRILQAAGSAGTITQGMVGDIVVSAERGQYMAYTTVTTIFGPSVSPIIGGLLAQYAGWHWIFWFLLILAGATFVPFALFLPETCRHVVDNASFLPPWPCMNITDSRRFKTRMAQGESIDQERLDQLRQDYKLALPRPRKTISVLTDRTSALLLTTSSLALASQYAILTPLSHNFQTLYHFSDVDVSLVAFGMGIGSIMSSFTTGRLLDWNYRRLAHKMKIPYQTKSQIDVSKFPVEQARLQVGLPIMFVTTIAVLGFGWTLREDVPSAVPIVFVFISGYGIMGTYQVLSVLMADAHHGSFAVAAAARNVYSCLIGAVASAVVVPMANAMGNGWTYTIFAIFLLGSLIGPHWAMKHGMARRVKQQGTH